MEIQQDLGPDIAMAFDQCAPYPCTYEEAVKAIEEVYGDVDVYLDVLIESVVNELKKEKK